MWESRRVRPLSQWDAPTASGEGSRPWANPVGFVPVPEEANLHFTGTSFRETVTPAMLPLVLKSN
jgi:hypothetical protein